MIRRIVAVWVSLAMLFGLVVIVDVVTDITPTVKAATITVDDSGGADYTKIQDAIIAANPGDTVFVYNGTYIGSVVVNKRITLIGENRSATIIDANRSGSAIRITVDNVNVSGFSLTRSGWGTPSSGIRFSQADNCRIINNCIYDNYFGIYFDRSINNNLSLNKIEGNGIYIHGDLLNYWNTHNIDTSNTVNGKPVYYLKNQTGGTIPPGAGQVILANCTNFNVENQTLVNSSVGIELGHSSFNNIRNNNVSNNIDGICLYESDNNIIENNSATFNKRYGIRLYEQSDNNEVRNNSFLSNGDYGLDISDSKNNIIISNILNLGGIRFTSSPSNNVINNIISYSLDYGILLRSGSQNCNITNNDIFYNGGGIFVESLSDINISSNDILFNEEDGIYIGTSTNINIEKNNMSSNNRYGIHLWGSSNNYLLNNIFNNDGTFIMGGELSHYNSHTIPTNNLVNGKPLYYFKNLNSINLDDIPTGQVILANCANFIVTNLNINNTDVGVELAYSTNSIINNITSSQNIYGICSHDSNNNAIEESDFTDNTYGIYFLRSDINMITSNNISDNDCGMEIRNSDDNDIVNNNISLNNQYGINLQYSSNINLINNNITLNTGYGVYLYRSTEIEIINNHFINDGVFIEGFNIEDFNSHTILDNNLVNGKPLYYYKNTTKIDLDNIPVGQLIFANCSNINISNVIINNTDVGIQIVDSTNVNITNSNIKDNLGGVYSYRLTYGEMAFNDIHFNQQYGIFLKRPCTYIEIRNNNISNNEGHGIWLQASYCNVTNNNISSNNQYGIFFHSTLHSNIIGNNVMWNGLYGIHLLVSKYNRIFHNNIIDNSNQSYDDFDVNIWNNTYPSGGNYWSDYNGTDIFKGPNQDQPGSDGIGDVNYSIDSDSIDYYPLLVPYNPAPHENVTTLKQGWNLVSVPLIQEEQNITRTLGSIDGWYSAVQWHDIADKGDPWKHYKVSKPFGNDLSHLNESMGFWIHITNPGETIFLYNGTQPTSNQSITLHPGWNMVGYPSIINRTRDNALNNINYGTDVDAIWTFNAATQTWQEIGPTDYFELGRGYWIHSKVTKVWDVPL